MTNGKSQITNDKWQISNGKWQISNDKSQIGDYLEVIGLKDTEDRIVSYSFFLINYYWKT